MSGKVRNYTDEFKLQIVSLIKSGKSSSMIAKEYGIAKSSVTKWVRDFNKSGSFKAKDNRTPEENELRRQWYENADEIAAFFACVNPFWCENKWRTMLYSHLEMTEKEAGLRLNKEYRKDIAMFGQIETEAMKMADEMSAGIIRQFLCK